MQPPPDTFWLEGQTTFSILHIHTIFIIMFYLGIIEINQGKRPKRHSHLRSSPVPISTPTTHLLLSLPWIIIINFCCRRRRPYKISIQASVLTQHTTDLCRCSPLQQQHSPLFKPRADSNGCQFKF